MVNAQHAGIYQDPDVVRMTAILPTGNHYDTDFFPRINFKRTSNDGWNPHLMVSGEHNASGSYLLKSSSSTRDVIPLNVEGREASFRVRRPEQGSYMEEAFRDMPRAPHELNSMGIILLPYKLHEAPRTTVYRGGGGTKSYAERGSIGEAVVSTGQVGYASAGKYAINAFGDTMLPDTTRKPVVYSVRFLTSSRR